MNKQRARSGEARRASRTSTRDMSAYERGGRRSHSGPQGPTKDQLYNEAKLLAVNPDTLTAAARPGGPSLEGMGILHPKLTMGRLPHPDALR